MEEDDNFNTKMNILLILDDLFSESGKDKCIADLFTEGSHHRSLSVISIYQSLFGTKDPKQRRNCHYMVVLNIPVLTVSYETVSANVSRTKIFTFQPANAGEFKAVYSSKSQNKMN
jgi:hypothetical protein